jgi:GT2 family glycosyltransferase
MTTASAGGPDVTPQVSVIIPAYRFDPYLDEAIESVIAQTHRDFELIVVNDGSKNHEGVERIRARFGHRLEMVTRENGGPGAARNTGIRVARASIVAFLDEDDLWEPAFLAEQLALLERRPDADMAYANAFFMGDSRAAGRLLMDLFPTEGEPTLENLLARRCNVVMSAVMGKREVFERVGLFDETRSYAEDYDLWLRIVHAGGRITYQRKALLHRRIHEHNLTRDNERLADAVVVVLERFGATHQLTPAEQRALDVTLTAARSELALERCKASLARGDVLSARRETAVIDRSRLGWKGRIAIAGLVVLPHVVGALYRVRERSRSRAAREPTPGGAGEGSATTEEGAESVAGASPSARAAVPEASVSR